MGLSGGGGASRRSLRSSASRPPRPMRRRSRCESGCAHRQIAPAIRAASPGDEILVGPGTYRGGFDIPTALTLAGSGADRTTISGGGPVVTVGTEGASTAPTVQISDVTITGGRTTSSDDGPYYARGGGVLIPSGAVVNLRP
jgi:hypothetical protein